MRKIYIAARARHRTDEVKQIVHKFEKAGWKVSYNWTTGQIVLKKPYREPKNRVYNVQHIKASLRGASNTDVFVLLDDEGLRGVYIEYGAFLNEALNNPKGRQAYIVGKDSHIREHVFESPEFVKFCDTIEEVYKDLKIK
jgi:hypothetical protein